MKTKMKYFFSFLEQNKIENKVLEKRQIPHKKKNIFTFFTRTLCEFLLCTTKNLLLVSFSFSSVSLCHFFFFFFFLYSSSFAILYYSNKKISSLTLFSPTNLFLYICVSYTYARFRVCVWLFSFLR